VTEYLVGKVDDIPRGGAIAIAAGHRTIAVFRIGDDFFAINNTCPHKGAALCDGEIIVQDRIVRCPWHHWNWRLHDGRLESDPRQSVRTYPVAVDGDEVILRT
jgi:nitrite reductase (NADH) small subunit/3-phenylpropionate/trans-cinnamate dioxygenase ferredoxin subunit